jgi:hypothetical protein
VAGSCEYGDEHSGSGATELVLIISIIFELTVLYKLPTLSAGNITMLCYKNDMLSLPLSIKQSSFGTVCWYRTLAGYRGITLSHSH